MYKISTVVPIYNAQDYLYKSIESIQKQTLQEIQIVLVNDGSIDNSLSICREFQKKDERIIIVDKPNGGVSSARNAGMEVAVGEYISFIDPDDWIDVDMYENLYNRLKEVDADVAICNYVIENNGKSTEFLLNLKQDVLNGEEISNQLIHNMIGSTSLNSKVIIMGSVWRLIIKKELIIENKFQFDTEIPFMEDLLFCVQILKRSNRVVIDNGVYYHYVTNSNSAVTSYRNEMHYIQLKVYKKLEQILKTGKMNSNLQKRLNIRYLDMQIRSIINEVHKNNEKKMKHKVSMIKMLCKDKKLKSILKQLDNEKTTIPKKIVLKAIKYESGLYLYVYYSLINKFIK